MIPMASPSRLLAMYPDLPGTASLFVHDVAAIGTQRAGMVARPLTELPTVGCTGGADRRVRCGEGGGAGHPIRSRQGRRS